MSITCQSCQENFTIRLEDESFYERVSVPPPTFCPECRMIRRMAWRNERRLFRKLETRTGKEIYSGFPPESSVVIFENDYWYSSDWDPLDYGLDYNPDIPFLEQFKQLLTQVPLPARSTLNLVNCDYCNEAGNAKNCYMCFNTDYSEDSLYSVKIVQAKECSDLYEAREVESSYGSTMITKCNRAFYSLDCDNCFDIWFSKGLVGCESCFGCVNLRKKKYHWFNEPLSKEEYEQRLAEFNSGSYQQTQEMLRQAHDFWLQHPVKYYHGARNTNTTGERIRNCKNVHQGYEVTGGEDLAYCQMVESCANCQDYTVWGVNAENIYECVVCGEGAHNLKSCFNCWADARNLEYCGYCFGSSNLFGCLGLQSYQYCILNKQYSRADYEVLRNQIIADMNSNPYIDQQGRTYRYGEFFPTEISPYSYHESLAYDYFPKTQQEALGQGYVWHDRPAADHGVSMSPDSILDIIDQIGDSITKEVLGCTSCTKPYRIVQQELEFYRKFKLPIPRQCPGCRFEARFAFVNPPVYYERTTIDGEQVLTSYSPEQPEQILSEAGFQNLVS